MLATLIAATFLGASGLTTPVDARACIEATGLAVVSGTDNPAGFQLFIKPPGETWTGTSEGKRLADGCFGKPWLVLLFERNDVDYSVLIKTGDAEPPRVQAEVSDEFDSYFQRRGIASSIALNNYGLHDIY